MENIRIGGSLGVGILFFMKQKQFKNVKQFIFLQNDELQMNFNQNPINYFNLN